MDNSSKDSFIFFDYAQDISRKDVAYQRVDDCSAVIYYRAIDSFLVCMINDDNTHTPVCFITASVLRSMSETTA